MSNDTPASLTQLNDFLRSEISAAETDHDVLRRATGDGTRLTLEDCAHSHESRAKCLRDAIELMGGTAAADSGAWGTFAGLFEGAARVFGGRATIAALAQGEDRGLRDYRENFWRLDLKGKELVETILLPAQERTRRSIHDLRRTLS